MAFLKEIERQVRALDPDRRQLRNLGLTFLVVLGAMAAWLCYRGRPAWPWLAGLAVVSGLWGLVWPMGLRPLHKAWMGLAAVMGYCVSRVLLSALYYLVITPMGLVMRLVGKDLLDLKPDDRDSYWLQRQPPGYEPRQTEKMF